MSKEIDFGNVFIPNDWIDEIEDEDKYLYHLNSDNDYLDFLEEEIEDNGNTKKR